MSQVVCTEAIGAKVVPVAKEALLKLHERICASGEGIAPGDEASVLRCLIRLTAGRLRTLTIGHDHYFLDTSCGRKHACNR